MGTGRLTGTLLTGEPLARLNARVEQAIQIFGYKEFNSTQLAEVLGVDKYDILFSLHQLRNKGIVEKLNDKEYIFADRWKRVMWGKYFLPVSDGQACKL